MFKINFNILLKGVILGIVWAFIFVIMGLFINIFIKYNWRDVLFIEILIVLLIVVMSSIGVNPMGSSIQALGQNNYQYVANANIEAQKLENEKNRGNLRASLTIGLNRFSLIIGGTICMVIYFLT